MKDGKYVVQPVKDAVRRTLQTRQSCRSGRQARGQTNFRMNQENGQTQKFASTMCMAREC